MLWPILFPPVPFIKAFGGVEVSSLIPSFYVKKSKKQFFVDRGGKKKYNQNIEVTFRPGRPILLPGGGDMKIGDWDFEGGGDDE